MIIPKLLHQLWVGPTPPPLKWMNTWKEKHPDWEYVFWGNKEIENFRFKNQKHIDYYIKKEIWFGVADLTRYEILNKFGGVWQGADSECFLPIDELFVDEKYDAYTFYENEKARPGLVAPLMACTPDNEFAQLLIDGLFQKENVIGKPWRITGNAYMCQMIEKVKYSRLKIFPSHYFVPEHHTGLKYEGNDKIYAFHHFGTTLSNYNYGR